MEKSLVAYFSCSGVTEKVAQRLAAVVNGDLYKIEPAVPYTDADLDWKNPHSRSSVEMQDKTSRPAVKQNPVNMEQYDTIYIGFPIWWYIAPTIINTFLEQYDFSGKVVVPFATSGSSGVGETDKWLHSSCSKKTLWRPARRFPSNVQIDTLKNWVNELKLQK